MLFLGEDFSFCWLARRAGCTIKAWFSSTLGHEVSHIICDTKHKFTDETQKSLFCPDQIILKGRNSQTCFLSDGRSGFQTGNPEGQRTAF